MPDLTHRAQPPPSVHSSVPYRISRTSLSTACTMPFAHPSLHPSARIGQPPARRTYGPHAVVRSRPDRPLQFLFRCRQIDVGERRLDFVRNRTRSHRKSYGSSAGPAPAEAPGAKAMARQVRQELGEASIGRIPAQI
ncbi:hypothetical protein BD414DRAFT_497472 [Trametes punicea]|nr:hypothetical protein BD414DRAFT_497472 [Trametes punicea]